MNYLLSFILFLSTISVFSQCDFEIIDFEGAKINATPKEMFVLKENQEALTGDYILFSMFTDGNSKQLLTTFSRVARHQFPEFCFGEDAFLRFTFKDGTSVKLSYEGEEKCKQQEKHPSRAKFNVLKIESKFTLSEDSVSRFKNEKVKSVTISGTAGLSFTYEVVKKIAADQSIESPTYPTSYFKNKLPCLEF